MPAFHHIAIDGKCLRGSDKRNPIHMVSAFATEAGLMLAQREVPGKGCVLAAIPHLLEALELRGAIVSLDALGCKRELPGRSKRGADYLLAVKGNQPGLHQALKDAFADQPDALPHEQTLDRHGRKSIQTTNEIPKTDHVERTQWPDCASLGRVLSLRVQNGKPGRIEARYYISSAMETAPTTAGSTYRIYAGVSVVGERAGQWLSVEVSVTGQHRPNHVVSSWLLLPHQAVRPQCG